MDTIKCPVCGSPGISDYKKEDVTCPHCGSDLKIYRTVSELSEENDSSGYGIKKFKTMSFVLPIITAIVAVGATYLLCSKSEVQTDNSYILAEKEKTISTLKDSVSVLNSQILDIKKVEDKGSKVEYVVVQNDGPWRIVHKFFGYRKDWEEIGKTIAEENKMWDSSTKTWKPLRPGQILKINTDK